MDRNLLGEDEIKQEIKQEIEQLHRCEDNDVESAIENWNIDKTIEGHTISYIDINEEDCEYEKTGNTDDVIEQAQENSKDTAKDTSFETYVQTERMKEKAQSRSFMGKIRSVFKRICIGIFRMPMNIIVMGGLLGLAAIVLAGVITSFGAGIFILGATAFVGTASSSLVGLFGMFTTIALFSVGGLLILLFIMIIKVIRHRILAKRRTVKGDY